MTSATCQEVTRTLSHLGGWAQSPHALEGSWKGRGRSGAGGRRGSVPGNLLTSVPECVGLCFLLTVFSPGWSAGDCGCAMRAVVGRSWGPRSGKAAAGAVLLAGALVLAACGGGEGAAPASSAPTGAAGGTGTMAKGAEVPGPAPDAAAGAPAAAPAAPAPAVDAALSGLALSGVTLSPAFASGTVAYTASAAKDVTSTTVTVTAAPSDAAVSVNGKEAASGKSDVALTDPTTTVTVTVAPKDGKGTPKTYTIAVTRDTTGSGTGGSTTTGSGTNANANAPAGQPATPSTTATADASTAGGDVPAVATQQKPAAPQLAKPGAAIHRCLLPAAKGVNWSGCNNGHLVWYPNGANLEEANLAGANLEESNLAGANLAGANLYGTQLYRANLAGANLQRIYGFVAVLTAANLRGADLSNANLTKASLSFANLTGANLAGARLDNVDWNEATCPNGLRGPYPCTSPAQSPGAPTAVTATPTAGNAASITVAWTSPASDGGSPITGYTSRAFTALTGSTPVGTCTTPSATATSCAVGGLKPGSDYFVDVVATNAAGSSAASSPRVSVKTPTVPPGAPTAVTAAPNDPYGRNPVGTTITIKWAAPASDGGSPITDYTALASTAVTGGSVAGKCRTASATATSCVIDGLRPATDYFVDVYATNAQGDTWSSPRVKVATPTVTPPGAPTAVSAVPVNGAAKALRISWTAPASDGGSAIVFEYTATAYASPAGASPVSTCKTGGGLKTCDIGGLSPATQYLVDVVATNAAGNSPASARVKAVTLTPTVTNVQLPPVSGVTAVRFPGCDYGTGCVRKVSWKPAPTVQGMAPRYTVTLTDTTTKKRFTCVPISNFCAPVGLPFARMAYDLVVTYEFVGTTLRPPAHSPVRVIL